MTSINRHMAFFVLMVLSKLFSSACTTTWDLVMDWGLLDRTSKENLFLRDELVYRFRAYYYVAIIEDVIIRFAWILPLVFSHFEIIEVEIITTIVMFAEVNRRIIWNFFRLENEHLNNCGNFRAVRDIGIAPIRKETSKPPITQDGDKTYGMFNHLLTLNHNNINPTTIQSLDANGSGSVDDVGAENVSVSAKLAEYASRIKQNNHKSLWNHLRSNFFQLKKERRRRLDLDLTTCRENAQWIASNADQQLSSSTLPTLGASPIKNPDELQTNLHGNVQHRSFSSTTLYGAKQQHDSTLTPPERSQHLRIVADGRQRHAFGETLIPHTVCNLNPQQLEENRASVFPTPSSYVDNVPPKAPGTQALRPQKINVNSGLDTVIAPEILSHMREDYSPDDTVLPNRTNFLSNQLRELLKTFNNNHSTATTTSAGDHALQSTIAAVGTAENGRSSQLKIRQPDGAGGYGTKRVQTSRRRRWVNGATEGGRSASVICRRSNSRGGAVRFRSASVPDNSSLVFDKRARHNFGEGIEDAQKIQSRNKQNFPMTSQPATPAYPRKFTVESVLYRDGAAQ